MQRIDGLMADVLTSIVEAARANARAAGECLYCRAPAISEFCSEACATEFCALIGEPAAAGHAEVCFGCWSTAAECDCPPARMCARCEAHEALEGDRYCSYCRTQADPSNSAFVRSVRRFQ